ncbi:MAG: hypothetical protein Q9218_003949 [Villophora microphyllina]
MLDVQRLYVSPLDAELLPVILPGPLREVAQNISFHTLQSLPDKRYGYFELPKPEADHLKKKLNGSILRGVKMRVDQARPRKREGPLVEDTAVSKEGPEKKGMKVKSKGSSTTKEDGVLPGIELPVERKVQRGWTEPAAKEAKKAMRQRGKASNAADARASTYTDGPECLFKTKLPPNVGGNTSQDSLPMQKPKKRKRGESERDVVVHEFERTTKQANFLRDENKLGNTEFASSYLEGQGWLDKDGNIIEAERVTRRTRSKATSIAGSNGVLRSPNVNNAKLASKREIGRSSKRVVNEKSGFVPMEETSSSGSSTSDSEEETAVPVPVGDASTHDQQSLGALEHEAASEGNIDSEHEINTVQVRGLSISRSSPTPPPETSKEVHPLEALFKRPLNAASETPRKPSLEVKTGFSFFEPDIDEDSITRVAIPQTPFTQQDFQERRLRSAAPTPDTAAPGKTTFGRVLSWGSGREDVESDEDEAASNGTPLPTSNAANKESEGEGGESEFTKWFYEHRGETNRAWKRRRREAAKEKRQKENKRR